MEERMLTPEEVANLLNVEAETVRTWLRRGLLVGYKISKKEWRVKPSDIEDFLNKRRNVAQQQEK